ncbi:MAG TPA: GNAT family protein [Anaerolineales bacterium]|nr:GNAT family protein [Anaerolineales bacterium]
MIIPISQDYFDAFHTCLDEVSRERKYLGFVEAPPLESTRKWLKSGVDQGEIRLIAMNGVQVIGWCDIELNNREGFRHSGKLGIGVLKEFRGTGIGTKLLTQALSEAQLQNLERIELEVYESNLVAIKLYERLGFKVEGRKRKARKIDGHYDDVIMMALILKA